uniref:Peptidyl-prolyl cis-trans isomerase n=1 Tax=Chromera velia CCMP2878 TaxID=1169474 RepID=A0A0G4GF30_9ALVE|mmetsp:Transcript_36648/g.72068  ORF Transcript_36648/g.72068 Transcript_36648/m.72068 type:complete len:112 (+) Transcript_36648:152-487(+)|eukprot:Cvel_21605.t1-p1 / transcript=Cvel_21605.t1 / gene=Cvel_21605 / organism=Chromera_velia_CCMP2878 / gene_product=Putative peptidyl-prolyl cis-trans isomerase dodo, putative / transcript_product=Putative peptidyl-prolyl cis-trans isomerase dodo, putative / location=Cvel_scaffold2040:31433-33244(+) / protein_length=111 / sequence_SO=supercontig / SO=protein_coding / is_pseudo=false
MSSVACRHLLLKHTGSRNPVSRRDNSQVTRSPDQAKAQLNDILKTITPVNFAQLAQQYSECSSYKQGGDLGDFGRGVMDSNFEAASFALKVGEISGIVDSGSGSHLILRYK